LINNQLIIDSNLQPKATESNSTKVLFFLILFIIKIELITFAWQFYISF